MRSLKLSLLGTLVGLVSVAAVAHAQTTLKVANQEIFAKPPKVAAQYSLEFINKQLPKVTNGDVDVKLYPNAELGNEKELVKEVGSGTVDATVVSTSNAAGSIPEFQIFGVSYLFQSYDHVRRVLQDDAFFSAMQKIVADHDLGFKLVGVGVSGTRNLYSRKRIVKTMKDLKGLKMRVMASPTQFKIWSTLGTLPTNISATEIYTALQTGVVDAAESSLPAIAGNKYYEAAPHISLTRHQFNVHIFLLSDTALAKIPETDRAAVLKTFREAGIKEISSAEKLSKKVLKSLREQPGVTVTDVNTKPLAKTLHDLQDQTAKNLGVENLLKIVRSKQ